MNIYILSPRDEQAFTAENWDIQTRYMIRAETEIRARQLAAENSGFCLWNNVDLVTCTPLTLSGEEAILLTEKKVGYNKSLSKFS